MFKIFSDTRLLDSAAREKFGLTQDLMMENAAVALEEAGREYFFSPDKKYITRASVLVLCGAGNNGADGYALARRIAQHSLAVTVCQVYQPKSPMCIEQFERAQKAGVQFINIYDLDDYIERTSFDLRVVYDCIFGSGFHGQADQVCQAVVQSANKIQDVYKIACDVPTENFCADQTVCMGALKTALFSDKAKDLCGKITVCQLGVSRTNFEGTEFLPQAFLLEKTDGSLPVREKIQNSNKGTFGHTAVFAGTKPGAAVIAGTSALKFGSGLVTLVATKDAKEIPYEKVSDFSLMHSKEIPSGVSALVVGPGLGRPEECQNEFPVVIPKDIPLVLDADIFYWPQVKSILETNSRLVLTPHPKEFAQLLKNCGIKNPDGGDYTTAQVVEERFDLVKKFSLLFPNAVLLLKGANVLIAKKFLGEEDARVYVNAFGNSALAKGGSGDVLSGMVGSLLAQGYEPLKAAASASLAHAVAAQKFLQKDYALTPFDLIQEL